MPIESEFEKPKKTTLELMKEVEIAEGTFDKLKLLIHEIDSAAFPYESLEIEKVFPENWQGGASIIALSYIRDKNGKVVRKFYEANPNINTTEEASVKELIIIAFHEVRHRIQKEMIIEQAKEENFELEINKYPALHEIKNRISNMMAKRKEARKRLKPLSKDDESKEFDAHIIETLAFEVMQKENVTVQEIVEKILKADIKSALQNAAQLLK